MSKNHVLLFSLLSLLFFISIKCEDVPEEFIISEHLKEEQFESLTKTYKVPIVSTDKHPLILVKVFPADSTNPTFVFISKKLEEATNDKCAYKSLAPKPFVFIPSSYYPTEITELYVKVFCEKNCNYKIGISHRDAYILEDNATFEVFANSVIKHEVLYYPNKDGKDFQLTVQSGEDGAVMEVSYGDKKYPMVNVFKNGYGVIIKANENQYNEAAFVLSFQGKSNTLYTISHRLLPITTVEVREMVNIMLDGKTEVKSCFKLSQSVTSPNASSAYILNALSYTRNANIYIMSQAGVEGKKVFVDSTAYLRFTGDDFENEGTICVRPMDGYAKLVGLQFQILNEYELLQSQGFNAPLLRGTPIRGYLPKGDIMFYRINTLPAAQAKMNINFHMKKGEPLFYYAYVKNFPYIKITAEEIKNMGRNVMVSSDINDHFYFMQPNPFENPHINTNQIGGIVHCPETSIDGCEFDLTIGITAETIEIVKDMKMYQPKDISESHQYRFEITDPTISSFKVYLYSFAGDGELKVSTDQYLVKEAGKYNSAGNKEYYECINQAKQGEPNTLLGKYYVEVTARFTPIYYSIHYSTYHSGVITEIDVASGEVITETITKKEASKKFTFVNRLTAINKNYFANIMALNCDISIQFSGTKYFDRINTFIIKPSDAIYQSGRYTFEITLIAMDTQSQDQDENCLMYLSGDEVAIDKELVLNEGINHSMTLNQDVNKIVYLYPYLFTNNNEKIAINFNKEDEGKVKVTYSINDDKQPESVIVSNANKKIYLSNQLSTKCASQFELRICPIFITVELADSTQNEGIDFNIGVFTKNEIPFYLPKGVVKQGLIGFKHNQYIYYYTDIRNLESGEIVLNFKRGNGLMVARIKAKSAIDEHPNWNKKVRLPNSSYKDVIPFDYFNKKIVFTEEHTKNCIAAGCELYIGVYLYESFSYLAEYSIFIRNDDSIVTLPENNLVFGSLSKIGDEVDYYSVHIHTDTDRILLNLIGELCFGYVMLGKGKPTKQNAKWVLDGKNSMFEIKASDPLISSPSMIGKTLSFAIGTRGLENIYSSFYSFKIISPIKSIPTIIEVSSSYNEMCDVNAKDGYCYFSIPIDPTGQLMRICINTLSEKIANSKFEIYTRYVKASVYDFLSPQDKFGKFPTELSYDTSSAKDFNTNYLCTNLEYLQWSVESYLLVLVKSKETGRVTFLSNYYNAPRDIYVKPNSKEMFVIKDASRLIVYGRDDYYIEIVRLDNEALVSTSYETNLFINKEQKNLAIILNSTGENLIYIRPQDSTKPFYCYIHYLLRPKENFDEIKYGRYNYITYSTPRFPMIYYIPIESEEENILVNVRLSVYEYKDEENSGDDDFIIQGLVTDENFIIKRKKDSTVQPEVASTITEPFNQSLLLGRLTFTSKMIKEHISDSKKYLYVSIKQKESNKHQYTHLSSQVIAMPENSVDKRIVLPSNQYLFTRLNTDAQVKMMLFKNDPLDEIIEIEFSHLDIAFKFSVNPIPENDMDPIDHTKNSTIFKSEKTLNGRNLLEINVANNNKGIAFIVFKPANTLRLLSESLETSISNDFFAIKYQTGKTLPRHYIIANNVLSWEASKNREGFTIIFESISDEIGKVPQTNYYINYYATTNSTQLDSIYMKQEPIGVDKIVKSKDGKLSLTSMKAPKGDFYFTVTAVTKIENTEEILLYQPNGRIEGKPADNDPKGSSYIYYIIGGIVLVLIIVGLLVFYYLKYRKEKKVVQADYKKIDEAGPVIIEDN